MLAVCGWSGSGKTTLIEGMLPRLLGRGLAVAVVKHDAHGVQVDRRGKDSDRLFRAGADVLLRGPEQEFFRRHGRRTCLRAALGRLARTHDLVLVEGHKGTPLPKLWLESAEGPPPPDTDNILARLPADDERLARALETADRRMRQSRNSTPLLACAVRTNEPRPGGTNELPELVDNLARFAALVVLPGPGPAPEGGKALTVALPPGTTGTTGGVLTAVRWAPEAEWLIAAHSFENLLPDAFEWLLAFREPGVWGVLPRSAGECGGWPAAFYLDLRGAVLLQNAVTCGDPPISALRRSEKVLTPDPPAGLPPGL